MRTRLFAILVLVAIGVFGAIGAAGATRASEASHGGQPLHATLQPESEVASNGSGSALVTLNQGQSEVCFDITVSDLTSPVILAHIHQGAAGTNGPIVVDFMEPVNGLNGCVHADAALISEIRHDRAGFYVNVHTTMFPTGEVRGQLG
jgi:hypothetical protein